MRMRLSNTHEMDDVEAFVFDAPVKEPFDFDGHREHVRRYLNGHKQLIATERVYLYVSGMSPLLVAFLHTWTAGTVNGEGMWRYCGLTLMHYDRESKTYKEDVWV